MSKENINNPFATEKKNEISRETQLIKPNVEYFFLLADDKLMSSPNKDLLLKLAGPNNTIPHAEEVISELNINHNLTVTRLIPSQDQQWRIIPAIGISCRATSSKAIELFFDPNNPNTIASLTIWSGRQIAHELNHIARMESNPDIHMTLLDALISEGLGVYYEEHWKQEYKQSIWGHVLSERELETEWSHAQKELSSNTFDYGDWFYGNHKGHKIYAGYSLGNALITKLFDKYPGLQMSKAVRTPSCDLLKEIGFKIT